MKYSKQIPGSPTNYNWPVTFDSDRGIIGINQQHDNGDVQRVLLSKKQVYKLREFLGVRAPKAKSRN